MFITIENIYVTENIYEGRPESKNTCSKSKHLYILMKFPGFASKYVIIFQHNCC